MMVSLKVDSSSLGNLAEQLDMCSQALEKDTDTAVRLLSTIGSSWSGEEFHGVIAEALHSTEECQRLYYTLHKLATHLRGINESYHQMEECLVQNIKNLGELN